MVTRLMNGLKNYNKGTFGTIVETFGTHEMKKGGRMGVAPNPLLDRVTKNVVYTNVRLGVDYDAVIKAKLEREGKNPADWHTSRNNVGDYYNEYLLRGRKDTNQFYLKIGLFPNTHIETTYFVDGRPATAEEMKTIEEYALAKSESQKQVDAGLPLDKVYKVFSPNLDKVTLIQQGDRVLYNRMELAEVM